MLTEDISTEELSSQLDKPEVILVDIRPPAAYNGWRLKDEACGGHIRGAVNFPISWIKELSDSEIENLLQLKGITSEKTVVMYGYKGDNCSRIARVLQNVEIRNLLIYESGLQDWAAEPGLPMDFLTRYEKLVHAEWVHQLVSSQELENFVEGKPVLAEVSFGSFEEYRESHIPGAVYFDLALIENPSNWNICSSNDLLEFLSALGITYTSQVVLYGRDTMAAARAACILMYAGVEDVRLLDGGFDAWLKAGFGVESGVKHPIQAKDFGTKLPGHPEYIVDMDTVKTLLTDDQGVLVSVRSWDEFIGKTSGYDFIKAKGHIPGAVWGHSGSDPHHMQDYRNPDKTMRSFHEIASNWRKAGITPEKKVAFYCGTGWRASEAFFYAYLMGWPNIAVYDGGWLEWSQDATNPISFGTL